jgi:predicted transglutaminase-like cysteine proteinase
MSFLDKLIAWFKKFLSSFGKKSVNRTPTPAPAPDPVPPPNPNGDGMITKEDLDYLHNRAFKLFNYKHDDKNYGIMEDWRSHADLLAENKEFTDDCDGYAFTIVETLLNMGADKDKVKFIVCETETGEGHAVAGYTIGDKTWILENRYPNVYDWNVVPGYKWYYFMKFDEPGQWYEVTNA